MQDRYAENNAFFIFTTIDRLKESGCTVNDVDIKSYTQNPNVVSDFKGLYIFYVTFNSLETTRIPIYVGVTDQGFRTRFRQHKVIEKYFNPVVQGKRVFPAFHVDHYPPEGEHIFRVVTVRTEYGLTAKLLESIFLNSFDFCMNKMENGAYRMMIGPNRQHQRSHSYKQFCEDLNTHLGEFHNQIPRIFNPNA